jgi:hypothetical protein
MLGKLDAATDNDDGLFHVEHQYGASRAAGLTLFRKVLRHGGARLDISLFHVEQQLTVWGK